MVFSMENMCRACMNEEGSMFSIYDKEKRVDMNISYAEMLISFASIQITDDDGLPKQICQYCLKQLMVAYTFKQTSERSDATLREITKDPEIEFIKEEIDDTYKEIVHDDHSDLNTAQNIVKTEVNDFKLSAEFLNDEFQIADEENAKFNVVDDNNIDELYGNNNLFNGEVEPKNESDDFELILKTLNNKPSELFTSILKQKPPKSELKLIEEELNNSGSNLNTNNYLGQLEICSKTKHHVCPLCNKQFVRYEMFKKHKRTHTTLQCEVCSKEFRSTHGLRYHMKIHNGIKNYACTFENCTKRFRLKQALDKHLSIHNNEKNHLCPVCGKTYAQYDALHYHIRNHTGERPYLCVHCGKTFKQSCHLKNHMWNHTGIKPYKCKSCGKCYTTGHQLKKHLRKYCNNPANLNTSNTNISSNHSIHVNEDNDIINNYHQVEDDIFVHSENNVLPEQEEAENLIFIKCE